MRERQGCRPFGPVVGGVACTIISGIVLSAVAPSAADAANARSAAPSVSRAQAGDAIARVDGSQLVLADRRIVHRWQTDSQGHVRTVELSDPLVGSQWSTPNSAEFSLTLGSVSTSSVQGWRLLSATAQRVRLDPARPAAGPGVQIAFRYLPANPSPGLLELDRTWSLYPGSAVQAVSSTLINRAPAWLRVGPYSLVELSSAARAQAEVQTYHGGSDWRQDFRVVTLKTGAFDQEGEIARFDRGGSGWFLASQQRSGLISRAGRDPGGRTWVGVDPARDVLDLGPLMSSPPSYNRFGNPVYPVPVRQRTLMPDATLELGRAYLGVYHGGPQQAAAAFVNAFAHEMPNFPRSVELNSFHPWGHGPGMSDANLRRQVDAFKTLGGETFMLDDQWQGSSAGDWQWNPARFPSSTPGGPPGFVSYVHARGLSLGLWMAPAEFNPASQAYRAHPSWACTPTGDATARVPDDSGLGVWDMNNPALRAHLTSVIDRLIALDGVREFKFDYVAWVDCLPHDYLDYEDAYVAWVRQLQARHPGVTFELDETNDQRLWPLRSVGLGPSWFDNGHLQDSTYAARLLHDVWSAAPWIAPSTLGFGTYDGTLRRPYRVDYLMPIALLGHLTFWSDLTKLSRAQRHETGWWLRWYRSKRSELAGLVYEDTSADPIDGRSWSAFQPWSADHGYLFVFRQGAAQRTRTVALQGLRPGVWYRLRDVRTGARVGVFSGRRLMRGLRLTMGRRYSAAVLSIAPGGSITAGHRRQDHERV